VLVRGALAVCVTESGFGRESTAESARSLDALAGYVTKLAGLADATAGEVAKITQAPLRAPVRFRRLRSGVRFLPLRKKNPNVTGTLVRRQLDVEGTVTVVPLHKVKADQVPYVIAACLHEESVVYAEAERRHIIRKCPELAPLLPRPPPVRAFSLRCNGPPVLPA
jgi:superfamily I DNA/RNA helicase